MIATGGAMPTSARIAGMGVVGAGGELDLELLRTASAPSSDDLEQHQREDPPQPAGGA